MIETVIPNDQWPSFCEQFGLQHQGGLTTVVRFRAAASPEMLDDLAPVEW